MDCADFFFFFNKIGIIFALYYFAYDAILTAEDGRTVNKINQWIPFKCYNLKYENQPRHEIAHTNWKMIGISSFSDLTLDHHYMAEIISIWLINQSINQSINTLHIYKILFCWGSHEQWSKNNVYYKYY